jgi:hypothetical protein
VSKKRDVLSIDSFSMVCDMRQLTGHVSKWIPSERNVFPNQPRVFDCLSSRQSLDGGGKYVAQRLVDRPWFGFVRQFGFVPCDPVPELT